MRFWTLVCLGLLLFTPAVGAGVLNGSICDRALSAGREGMAISAFTEESVLFLGEGESPLLTANDTGPLFVPRGEKTFLINGVDAEELLPLKAYLGDSLQAINNDADCSEFYMPVREICFKGCTSENALILLIADNEPIILTDEIPCLYAGIIIEAGEIPVDARGLLFLGKNGEPMLLYLYPYTLWGRILAVDSCHRAILLSGEEGVADSKRWYDLSPQLWVKLLPDLQKSDFVQVHIDRRNNAWRVVDIKILDY